MEIFDPTKPVQTRDGWKARILATDLKTSTGCKIVAAITSPDTGLELSGERFANGRCSTQCEMPRDLINVPVEFKCTVWVNVYPDRVILHRYREDADTYCMPERIACVKVELSGHNGDGLEG